MPLDASPSSFAIGLPAAETRLSTFFQFLREKQFIKPLSPQQIADLLSAHRVWERFAAPAV